MEKAAEYLRNEFKLAEIVKLDKEDNNYVFRIRNCHICHGDLVKKRFGIRACPISIFPVGAVTTIFRVKGAVCWRMQLIFKIREYEVKEERKN